MKISTLPGFSAFLLTGMCFLCAAQGKPEKTEPASVYSELEKAPAKYQAKANPLAKDKDAVAAGKVLFEEHCAECHGENALGTKKAPSLRAPEVQSAPPGTLFWILTNGIVRKGMPVWSKLPEPQRWQLVTYVQSLGPVEAMENSPPAKP
ncbi:MAG TPA: c-type cytochrome [Candidatus Sulfotelmatobacter sp.]|jgi:mono/diheme cytochrome c family protein|nr:c-type cytochrome [Candidatus Sulfotelmatobacter sp.]